jgi:hypothetical protein
MNVEQEIDRARNRAIRAGKDPDRAEAEILFGLSADQRESLDAVVLTLNRKREQEVNRARKRAILAGLDPDRAKAAIRGAADSDAKRPWARCALCAHRATATENGNGRAFCHVRDEETPAAFACDDFTARSAL